MKHRRMAYSRTTPPGVCRLCENPITDEDGNPDNRRRWHPECQGKYRMSQSDYARAKLFERDKGVCAKCGGKDCGADGVAAVAWEHDHIIPLKDGGTFDLDNLQTLGLACHKAKTAREAGERAKVRRIQKKRAGDQPLLRARDGQVLA